MIKRIHRGFQRAGYLRAAATMRDMGYHKEAKYLMQQARDLK